MFLTQNACCRFAIGFVVFTGYSDSLISYGEVWWGNIHLKSPGALGKIIAGSAHFLVVERSVTDPMIRGTDESFAAGFLPG